MRRMNVLIVHGIGKGEYGNRYARPFQANIEREFDRAIRRLRLRDVSGREARGKRALRFEAVDWAQVTQTSQNALLEVMGMRGRWNPLRRVRLTRLFRQNMVNLLGDVISYEGGQSNEVYAAIHAQLSACVDKLSKASAGERDEDGNAPLTVIGHSLGSVIGSDYVWDNTRSTGHSHILGERNLALYNYVSMGSPLALYALRNDAYGTPDSIRDSLPSPIKVLPEHGLWLNLFDPQDAIAFPLEPLRSYATAGVIDRPVRAGNWFTSWNLMSHVGYWRCDDAAEWIGRKLALDWAWLNSEEFAAENHEREYAVLQKDLRRR